MKLELIVQELLCLANQYLALQGDVRIVVAKASVCLGDEVGHTTAANHGSNLFSGVSQLNSAARLSQFCLCLGQYSNEGRATASHVLEVYRQHSSGGQGLFRQELSESGKRYVSQASAIGETCR